MEQLEQLEFDKEKKETNLHISAMYGHMP